MPLRKLSSILAPLPRAGGRLPPHTPPQTYSSSSAFACRAPPSGIAPGLRTVARRPSPKKTQHSASPLEGTILTKPIPLARLGAAAWKRKVVALIHYFAGLGRVDPSIPNNDRTSAPNSSNQQQSPRVKTLRSTKDTDRLDFPTSAFL